MKRVSHRVENTCRQRAKPKLNKTYDSDSKSFTPSTIENDTTLLLDANVYEQTTTVDNCDYVTMYLYLNETDTSCIENVTPLCAKNSMMNLGLRGKGMHVGHLVK